MVIGYIRVSTDKQDFNNQRYAILEYANKNKLGNIELIEIEVSSTRSKRQRRITELIQRFSEQKGKLIVTELSRIGRTMLETLQIINQLTELGVEIIFINQPELSIQHNSPHMKLIYAIYSYLAEAERDFTSMRTKQGLAAAKARGITLGRPRGARNKYGLRLDPYKEEIIAFLKINLSVSSIMKIINQKLPEKLSYSTFYNYCKLITSTMDEDTIN